MAFELILNNVKEQIQLTEEEQELFASKLKPDSIRKKEYLLQAGNICHYQYFITVGCLKKYYINEEGIERIFRFAAENQWVGDVNSFWPKTPTTFNIIALEDSEIVKLEKANLEQLFNEIPNLERYFRILGIKEQQLQQRRIKQSLSCSTKERYLDFRQDYPDLELRISQKEIASYLGVTPQFLSKLRGQLTPP